MKILTPRFKKIARVILWSMVAVLALFVAFMTGGIFILMDIEYECLTYHIFEINDHIFKCEVIPKGILS